MSILEILERGAHRAPNAGALHAPGLKTTSYSALNAHVQRAAASLRHLGFQRSDVIALVVPNGPDAASAFLSVSAATVCAPLNPAYRADELEFYLSDLPAKGLVIADVPDSPARDVARRLGIPVIELERRPDDGAGLFTLDGDARNDIRDADVPDANDVALVLHTSGTTSRPKIVPLTHGNLRASARNVAISLALTPNDLCLNVMPLFHIHGLVAALLASLEAGSGVICTPGFVAPNVLDWIRDLRPTWYTAVPTMHASIVARARTAGIAKDEHNLRFIRSSSSALPQTVSAQLEEIFSVPVIEAYGMTEAAHQIASNPLPPGIRKPGTVGRAAGPSIAILDPEGNDVGRGVRGEIAIKGPNVTAGYARNPAANSIAFHNGWLRTGDEGALDDDGYLTLLGRLKEMINRGGEKISPLEIDEVLMSHPCVAHALTFGAKDSALGEEVAAVVVLHDGMEVSERALREFVSIRLSHFKVPRRILYLPSIPTGPTGKPQRIGLAEKLNVSFDPPSPAPVAYVAPRTPVEEVLASVWSSVMGSAPPGVNENFFFAGGDSILALQFVDRVREALAVDLSLLSFFDSPTVADLAAIVEESIASETTAK
jgi:acyl-CoA synthetase (AMP-forming)/AMP-acid ligase II